MEADLMSGARRRQLPLQGILRISALAVDWIANVVYFVDDILKTLDVVSIDSGIQTNLMGYLKKPMDIAVDPNEG